MNRRLCVALTAVSMAAMAAGCSSEAATPMVVQDAWVRTTEGAKDTTMTALFATLSNPGADVVKLTGADCGSAARTTQVHEMVAGSDGKMMMQEAKGGVEIGGGSHLHLKPGGVHVMLMELTAPLPIGSEVTCTLSFSDGQKSQVTAPVKKFTEETDHYHPSASPSGNG